MAGAEALLRRPTATWTSAFSDLRLLADWKRLLSGGPLWLSAELRPQSSFGLVAVRLLQVTLLKIFSH